MWDIGELYQLFDKGSGVAHNFTEETEGSEHVIYFWYISSYCEKKSHAVTTGQWRYREYQKPSDEVEFNHISGSGMTKPVEPCLCTLVKDFPTWLLFIYLNTY